MKRIKKNKKMKKKMMKKMNINLNNHKELMINLNYL